MTAENLVNKALRLISSTKCGDGLDRLNAALDAWNVALDAWLDEFHKQEEYAGRSGRDGGRNPD